MKNTYDVIILGAVGIDTNVYLYGQEIDFSVECNFSQNRDYIGQAGGFTARGFAQLGYQTGFIGYIGQDYHGNLIQDQFEKDGIKTLFFIDPEGTKRSINFMYPDGRRKNFFDGKSAMDVKPDLAACRTMIKGSRLIHANISNWVRYVLPIAKELGITISTDLQDIPNIEDDYRKDFLEYADIVFFSIANFDHPDELIKKFIDRYPDKKFVCGMGKKGCAYGDRSGIQHYPAIELSQPVIDTNGAGDGLAVGFLSSHILESKPLAEAILKGQITARYTCTQKASTKNLINRNYLEKFYHELRERT
ncbi:MAG: carbohydrate kinase family protein [Spirochaetes bacterium]|nr:carbohydrate kinase family protein [Spirochaetota bacterium]